MHSFEYNQKTNVHSRLCGKLGYIDGSLQHRDEYFVEFRRKLSLIVIILLFFSQIIKKIINVMSVNFTCTLEKQYIMNPPFMVRKAWSVIESKACFISKSKFMIIF